MTASFLMPGLNSCKPLFEQESNGLVRLNLGTIGDSITLLLPERCRKWVVDLYRDLDGRNYRIATDFFLNPYSLRGWIDLFGSNLHRKQFYSRIFWTLWVAGRDGH